MAGIGFELKKIFVNNNISSSVKGFSYAIFVTSGPMIINLIMLSIIARILIDAGASLEQRDLFYASMTYSYIFSLLNVSGIIMIISRYVSDKLYIEDTKDILASMLGAIAISVTTGGIFGFIFYAASPLPFLFKLLSYLIFIELSVINILMVYVSAVRDYKKVTLSFCLGLIFSVVIAIVLKSLQVEILTAMLAGVTSGFLVNMLFLLSVIKSYFTVMTGEAFQFIAYMKKMPLLYFINLFYTAGLFGHNIIFWLYSDLSVKVMETYLYSASYDTATFYSVFTIIPSLVMFVVKTETVFFTKYREFGQSIINGGTFRDIKNAKNRMLIVLRNELYLIIKLQLMVTIISVITGANFILPVTGHDQLTIRLFVLLAAGYCMTYLMFIVITVLLYFDNQEDAFKTALMFSLLTFIFNMITILLGEEFYGLGLFASAFTSLLYSGRFLVRTLEDVDYRIFTKMTYYN